MAVFNPNRKGCDTLKEAVLYLDQLSVMFDIQQRQKEPGPPVEGVAPETASPRSTTPICPRTWLTCALRP